MSYICNEVKKESDFDTFNMLITKVLSQPVREDRLVFFFAFYLDISKLCPIFVGKFNLTCFNMKFNATIEVSGVKSKKAALNVLQVMLDDYEDMNPDAKEVVITLKDKCNG